MRTEEETDRGGETGPDGAEYPAPAPRRRSDRNAAGAAKGRSGKADAGGRARRKAAAVDGASGFTTDGDAAGDGIEAGAFKTRDLVDRVARIAGLKRRSAKPLVETVLAELSAALQEGRPLSLRPLGKVTVSKTREAGDSQVLVCRIRQRAPKAAVAGSPGRADEALADAEEGR